MTALATLPDTAAAASTTVCPAAGTAAGTVPNAGVATSRMMETVGTAEVLRQMHTLLDRAEPADATGHHDPAAALRETDRVIARLHALRLTLLAQADRCRVATRTGATGTAAWLAASTHTDPATASRDLRLATALDQALPATRQALTDGDLSPDHARVIATTHAQLPDRLRPDQRAAIETSLVHAAAELDPTALRRHARRALAAADATTAEVDAHQDQLLRTEEDTAHTKTRLTWHHRDDGTTTGHFTLPTPAAGILIKTVQQLASPRRFAQQAAKRATTHAAGDGTVPGAAPQERTAGAAEAATTVREATWEAFRTADGDWAHRYGKAFLELVEHLPTDQLNGKVAATVVVTIDHHTLITGIGAAQLDTGHDISASQARRLACNAGILPAILGGTSLPLDLGRQARFFSEPQRLALATTYDTCAADGCDRPYAWSELHHEDPWGSGGATDLHLAVPLCGDHHRRIHDPHYTHHIHTTALGTKTVTYTRRT